MGTTPGLNVGVSVTNELWDFVPEDWRMALESVHEQIDTISRELNDQGDFVPSWDNIFRALQLSPKDVQVVLVGQDPYPNPDYACGLSFSVPAGVLPLPGSLRNIIAEVQADLGACSVFDGNLEPWVAQGVLLLNRTLTTQAKESNAHKDLGWAQITEQIVHAVNDVNPNVVAVLWGKQAQELRPLFKSDRTVIGVHPSPLSAHRGFLGSRPFSAVNSLLQQSGDTPIVW